MKVVEGFEDALTGEAVERPKQEYVKPALRGVPPHLQKPGAVRLRARFFIGVFGDNLPALGFAELAKLAALVVYLLPFALPGGVIVAFVGAGRDAEVEGGADRCRYWPGNRQRRYRGFLSARECSNVCSTFRRLRMSPIPRNLNRKADFIASGRIGVNLELICNQRVGGSIPSASSIFLRHPAILEGNNLTTGINSEVASAVR